MDTTKDLRVIEGTNPLFDEIYSTMPPKVYHMQLALKLYGREGYLNHNIRLFEMNFELKFGLNHNLMEKYFPTISKGAALKWHFSLLHIFITTYKQFVTLF